MGAHGAGRQRAVAHRLELAALPEIHRHRDDLGAVPLLQPGDRHGVSSPPEIRQDDPFHACFGHSDA